MRIGLYISLVLLVAGVNSAVGQSAVPVGRSGITYTTLDYPGALITGVEGSNTKGDMVGVYSDVSDGGGHGFLYRGAQFTTYTYAGAISTFGIGINTAGVISGFAVVGAHYSGFTYDGKEFTTINAHGYPDTLVQHINDSGVITGGAGVFGVNHAFEYTGGKFRDVTPPPGGGFLAAYAMGAREGHGFSSTANQVLALTATGEWFDKYLLTGQTEGTANGCGDAFGVGTGCGPGIEAVDSLHGLGVEYLHLERSSENCDEDRSIQQSRTPAGHP